MISHNYANASPAQTRFHLFWPITFQDFTFQDVFQYHKFLPEEILKVSCEIDIE